jgi:hypothetical protein
VRKAVTLVVAGAATAAISVGGAVSAGASTPSPKLNKTDIAFLQSNHFVNLLESRLGRYIVNHAKDQTAVGLARETRNDHRAIDRKLITLSKKMGLHQYNTLPAPLHAVYEQVVHSKVKNLNYYKAQVAGHEQSIAATKYEISHGRSHDAKVYAKTYLPFAEAHLRMAKMDLAAYNRSH